MLKLRKIQMKNMYHILYFNKAAGRVVNFLRNFQEQLSRRASKYGCKGIRLQMFFKMGFLKNFANFTSKHLTLNIKRLTQNT